MDQSVDNSEHLQLKKTTLFLAEYAVTLMAVGVQTSRITINTVRIATALGYRVNLLLFPQTLSITLQDMECEHSYTYIEKTPALGLNFRTNSELSALSWAALDEHLSLDELWERFHAVMDEKRESPWTVLILVSFANACFCRLFDGNFTSMMIVWVATFVGFFIRQQLTRRHLNVMAVFIICSFVSTMIGASDYLYFHGGTEDMSLGTSMLYLVPGVPLINGVMDIIGQHVLNGFARLTNACVLIICIALGLSVTLLITGCSPFNFTKVVRPDILQAAVADGLFAAIAGTGFAIISNPPRKALIISAFLACVGHGIRYFLMHDKSIQMDQASASTIAGFTIGLLAIPFAKWIRYPAECFAFPSLLPMVPGMFAYKAIRDVINIVQKPDVYTSEYVIRFFHNSTLTLLVMFGMVVGAVIPIFIFHRQSYSVTRAPKKQYS